MLLVLVPRLLHRDLIDLILFPIAYFVDLNQFLALNVAANFISSTQKNPVNHRERPRNLHSQHSVVSGEYNQIVVFGFIRPNPYYSEFFDLVVGFGGS